MKLFSWFSVFALVVSGCATTRSVVDHRPITRREFDVLYQHETGLRALYHEAFNTVSVSLIEITELHRGQWRLNYALLQDGDAINDMDLVMIPGQCILTNLLTGCAILTPRGFHLWAVAVNPMSENRRYEGTLNIRHGNEPPIEWSTRMYDGNRVDFVDPTR